MEIERLNNTFEQEMQYRSVEIRAEDLNVDELRLSLTFVSEEPVMRSFGYEVIDQQKMDLSLMESGRAPFLWIRCEVTKVWIPSLAQVRNEKILKLDSYKQGIN